MYILFFKEALEDEENNSQFAICTNNGLIWQALYQKKSCMVFSEYILATC